MRKPRRPKLYFSFRSPYSWMAIERLRRGLPELFQVMELLPYWDPDQVTHRLVTDQGAEIHYQMMSKAKHLYVLADTKRMAARLGLTMAWPIDIDPWWEVPHLGWLAARRAGAAERCYDALVTARWQRAENICDPGVFQRVMTGAGLDGRVLAAATANEGIRAEGAECLVSSYFDDIFGVPYVRLGHQRYWGLDRMDMFLEEFRSVHGQVHGAAPPGSVPTGIAIGAYDRDTAGGCG